MGKNTPIVKDWLFLGMATGMAASVVKSLVNYALDKAGVPTIQHGTLAGNMVLGKRDRLWGLIPGGLRTPKEHLVGYAADTVAGAAFGAALSYVYAKSPPGNETLKGALGGAVLGLVTLSAGNQLDVSAFRKLTAGKVAALVGTSALFGGLEGMVIGKYGSKLATQSHPVLVKNVSDRSFERGRLTTEGRVAAAHLRRPDQDSGLQQRRPLDAGLAPTLY
ncbi:MAG TPA: hypothetical protein GXX28_03485 [Firmicutes bacterium]|nr:hypothetical protein [Bacillota bacterium]